MSIGGFEGGGEGEGELVGLPPFPPWTTLYHQRSPPRPVIRHLYHIICLNIVLRVSILADRG